MAKRGKDVLEATAGRCFSYVPEMWFFHRMIEFAVIHCMAVRHVPCPYPDFTQSPALEVWDTAVMARDWIARASDPRGDRVTYLASFDHCCEVLGWKPDQKRVELLAKVDDAADYDTDEVYGRIAYLTENPPDHVTEELFEAPRVVFERDQGNLFDLLTAA